MHTKPEYRNVREWKGKEGRGEREGRREGEQEGRKQEGRKKKRKVGKNVLEAREMDTEKSFLSVQALRTRSVPRLRQAQNCQHQIHSKDGGNLCQHILSWRSATVLVSPGTERY